MYLSCHITYALRINLWTINGCGFESNYSHSGPVLLRDGVYPLSKWILKPYIFSPTKNNSGQTLSAHKESFNKNLSPVTVEYVFGIIKVRHLLEMLLIL